MSDAELMSLSADIDIIPDDADLMPLPDEYPVGADDMMYRDDAEYDAYADEWDDDPSPYSGTYSEM